LIDWPQVAAAGYRFAAVRATVGDFLRDPFFVQNYDGASASGLLVTAYHVHVPNRPSAAQIDRFFQALDGRKSDLSLVLDVERVDGIKPGEITASLRECQQLVAERDGRRPLIYTANWFWVNNLNRSVKWKKNPLWVANYGVASPNIPPDWESWKFWQFTDRGSVPGVSAARTDLNWFNGSNDDLLAFAGIDLDLRLPPVPLAKVIVEVVRLTSRNGPGMNFEPRGDLVRDQLLGINLIDGDDVWLEFEPGKWASLAFHGNRLIEISGLRARVTAPTVTIRTEPAVEAQNLGELHSGDQFDILNIDGKDVWMEFEPRRWAPFAFRGVRFLSLIR
jgi:GH25 family lysozyme M1 (1,4-beta-N-acetylmuramidase)